MGKSNPALAGPKGNPAHKALIQPHSGSPGAPKKQITKKRAASAMEIQERRTRVLMLRKDGLSEKAIADALNMPRSTVWRDIQVSLSELAERRLNYAAEQRELMDMKFDELLRYWSARARPRREQAGVDQNGEPIYRTVPAEPKAADLVLRILNQKAELFGLHMPKKIEVEPPKPIAVQIVFGRPGWTPGQENGTVNGVPNGNGHPQLPPPEGDPHASEGNKEARP